MHFGHCGRIETPWVEWRWALRERIFSGSPATSRPFQTGRPPALPGGQSGLTFTKGRYGTPIESPALPTPRYCAGLTTIKPRLSQGAKPARSFPHYPDLRSGAPLPEDTYFETTPASICSSIHAMVFSIPTRRRVEGSQPRSFSISVLSLLRPLTPLGALRL